MVAVAVVVAVACDDGDYVQVRWQCCVFSKVRVNLKLVFVLNHNGRRSNLISMYDSCLCTDQKLK